MIYKEIIEVKESTLEKKGRKLEKAGRRLRRIEENLNHHKDFNDLIRKSASYNPKEQKTSD